MNHILANTLYQAVPSKEQTIASIDLSEFSFEEAILLLQISAPLTGCDSLHYYLHVHPKNHLIAYKIAKKYSEILGKEIIFKTNNFIGEIDWFIFIEERDHINKPLPLSEFSYFICGSYLNLNEKTKSY